MDLRDWLIAGGVLLVLVIVVDGIRRVRSRSKIKLNIDKEFENLPEEDFSAELPNGGARRAKAATPQQSNDEEIDLLMDESFKGVSQQPESPAITPSASVNVEKSKPVSSFASTVKSRVQSVGKEEVSLNNSARVEPVFGDADIDLLDEPQDETDTQNDTEAAHAEVLAKATASSRDVGDLDGDILGPVRVRKVVSQPEAPQIDQPLPNADLHDDDVDPRLTTIEDKSEVAVTLVETKTLDADDLDFNKPITELMADRLPAAPVATSDRDSDLDSVSETSASAEQWKKAVDADAESTSDNDAVVATAAARNGLDDVPAENDAEDTDLLLGSATDDDDQFSSDDAAKPLAAEPREAAAAQSNAATSKSKSASAKNKRKNKKGSRIQRWKEEIQTSFFDIDPGLDPVQDTTGPSKGASNKSASETSKSQPASTTAEKAESIESAEPQVLSLIVTAHDYFDGAHLFKLVEACGMAFGEMDIFHRHEQNNGQGPIQFSMVNGVKPGTFDLAKKDEFATPAVSFFLQMGEPKDLMNAFDCMLATAQCVADNLQGDVKDENHSVMRPQTIEHYRQQVRDFERRRLARRA